jgi:hypothetical protein
MAIRHVAIVSVPAGKGEPAHAEIDHPDPGAARAENAAAPLRWLSLAADREATSRHHRETLVRAERLLA